MEHDVSNAADYDVWIYKGAKSSYDKVYLIVCINFLHDPISLLPSGP